MNNDSAINDIIGKIERCHCSSLSFDGHRRG